ncbi:MAG: DUF3791 domain-containing protein [Propionibacteriaceae bacterium]|jgi:hypothetical protein|nr:DUF3791 domain-containing protein [Propionibacteriaceae bacterium]
MIHLGRGHYDVGMGKEQATATWVFFMLTAVRRRLGLTPSEFVRYAQEHGLIRFLFDHYELLHYYDDDYVVDDVLRLVVGRRGERRELSATG